jgi:peptidyl-prolyl cis-trans isomerase C
MSSIRNIVQTLRTHNRRIISVAAAGIGLTGAAVVWAAFGNPLAGATSGAKATQVIARVNGAPISRAAFERVWAETREQSRMLEMQENRQVVLDSVVGAELLAQQARNDGQVMAYAQLQAAMEMQTRNLLANAYVAEFLRRNPASDTVLKSAYDQLLKDLGKTELHLRHVLLAKQEDAVALHVRIVRGETTFAKALELTEEKTQDGKKGTGDLGWMAEGRLGAPLKASVDKAKGAGLLEPFADPYGWHVVQVEESRPLKAPAFETVRGELIPIAQRNQLRDHLAKIKAGASIAS